MSNRFDIDTLIVGQGLAGSLLAWELLERGKRILVLDDGHQSAASIAAAGLLNPVTGQRLVKSDRLDECLPLARELYLRLEGVLERPLLIEKPMWRLFRSEREQEVWERRRLDPAYSAYLGERLEPPSLDPPFQAPDGGFVQHQTGYLDTVNLLGGMQEHLLAQGRYQRATLNYAAIEPDDTGVSFQGVRCRQVIFCEGYKARNNPWFNWLPFQPAKGEILSVTIETPLPDAIINAGKWLMPRNANEYRLGATYDRHQLDEQPTEAGRNELIAALTQLFSSVPSFHVVDHKAGVRPNTLDKQPFIGLHPQWPKLGIFNGFGSKGSLLIPWHAKRFADALQGVDDLHDEVNISRYLSRFNLPQRHK